jgi:hypothetical protein
MSAWAGDWAKKRMLSKKYKATEAMEDLKALHDRMFKGKDFPFSITKDKATCIRTLLLVCMGQDMSHPQEKSRETCRLTQNADLVPV